MGLTARFSGRSLALARDQLAADPLHLYEALTIRLAQRPGGRAQRGQPLAVRSRLAAHHRRARRHGRVPGPLSPPSSRAATILRLAVYAASPNFFLQYAVWSLPFFLFAGYVWQVAAARALLLVPAPLVYLAPVSTGLALGVYVPLMTALWIAVVVCLARTRTGIVR